MRSPCKLGDVGGMDLTQLASGGGVTVPIPVLNRFRGKGFR
jgi:hypothetical protein